LKGRSVIVGADPKSGAGRGVVSSASYEARKLGIRSAMPISRAWKLCPDGIYLRPHFDLYLPASNAIMAILRGHADRFEQGGIDEAYLDISGRAKDFDEAADLARGLMEMVLEREHLTCSIGVAPNKMIAKIASDFRKPYGLTVVKPDEVKGFLNPLEVRKIPGVGPKTEQTLADMNIETVKDLACTKPEALIRVFGAWGARLHEFANGIDHREVVEEYETKSIGRDTTFQRDMDDRERILCVLEQLAEDVHSDVIANGFKFKTITIRIRYEHFDTHTSCKSLPFATNDIDILRNNARRLIAPFMRGKMKVRLVGVRVSNLV